MQRHGVKPGGWWVINKANGDFKYIPAWGLNVDHNIEKANTLAEELDKNYFRRVYSDEPETYRKKPTGNRVSYVGSVVGVATGMSVGLI